MSLHGRDWQEMEGYVTDLRVFLQQLSEFIHRAINILLQLKFPHSYGLALSDRVGESRWAR